MILCNNLHQIILLASTLQSQTPKMMMKYWNRGMKRRKYLKSLKSMEQQTKMIQQISKPNKQVLSTSNSTTIKDKYLNSQMFNHKILLKIIYLQKNNLKIKMLTQMESTITITITTITTSAATATAIFIPLDSNLQLIFLMISSKYQSFSS